MNKREALRVYKHRDSFSSNSGNKQILSTLNFDISTGDCGTKHVLATRKCVGAVNTGRR
jgi:hypothetical protein